MRTFTFLLILSLTSSLVSAAIPATVSTTYGMLEGDITPKLGMRVFRGVGYAAPPVGQNRWKEPQALPQWSGVRLAKTFAPRCVQGGFAAGAQQALTSEDCLYLNIWTPANSQDSELPVMVWIHGGGFFTGSGSADSYDGENLANKGAIVITINYRLGSFGFFAHPSLTAESAHRTSGNYAMLDILAALRWVQTNARIFGGDPNNVTVFGESAGAKAIANLMASPLSTGLFQRAIMQSSGWMGLSIARQATLAQRESQGVELLAELGVASIAELRELSAQHIFEKFPNTGNINVDGYVLPNDSSRTYNLNLQQPVEVLAGSNQNEAYFFGPGLQDMGELRNYAKTRFGPLAERFLALYPAADDKQANAAYLRAFSDEAAWQMRKLAQFQAIRRLNAWVYYFTHVPPGQEDTGATHVSELPYVFNQAGQNDQWKASDRQLADSMAAYWVNFATRGNPNRSGLPGWPVHRDNRRGTVMVLGEIAAAEGVQEPAPAILDFYEAAFERHLRLMEPQL